MRQLRVLLAVAVGALTSVVLVVPPAFACSCVNGSPADFAARADTVLVGAVTDIEDATGRSSAAPVVYRLAVESVLKGGAPGPEVDVRSAMSSASCGLTGVVAGRRYVVFAAHQTVDGRPSDHLWASSCGGTAPATARYLAAVERVTGPVPDVARPTGAGPDPDEGFPVAAVTATGAGVVVAAAAVALLRRRRRRA